MRERETAETETILMMQINMDLDPRAADDGQPAEVDTSNGQQGPRRNTSLQMQTLQSGGGDAESEARAVSFVDPRGQLDVEAAPPDIATDGFNGLRRNDCAVSSSGPEGQHETDLHNEQRRTRVEVMAADGLNYRDCRQSFVDFKTRPCSGGDKKVSNVKQDERDDFRRN